MNVPSTCSSYDHMGKNEVNQSTDRFDMTSSDVDSFVCSLASIGFDSFKGEDARHRALSAARKLTRRLETPIETAWAMSFDVPALYAALRAAHDNKIFIRLDEDGRKPKSTAGLADTADPALIRRILNHLAAMGIIEQLGADLWRGTSHSSSYRYPKISAVAEYSNQVTFDSYRNLPEYWRSVEYWPPDSIKGNWQHFIAKDQLFYDWVSDHPKVQDCFNNTMKGYTSQRGGWVDVYPTETIMLTAKQESPLVVDIGAGSGHDLMKFVQRHPEAAGRLIFQDRENVVKAATENGRREGLVPMPYDFFERQPVKGARAYFFHSILHNWPDREGRLILKTVSKAMEKNHSTVLINEMIVPDYKADRYQTGVDLCMASILNAKERSESEWTSFLKSAGFKVRKFWKEPFVQDGVIEAVPIDWTDEETHQLVCVFSIENV